MIEESVAAFRRDGFAILPGYLTPPELAGAVAELPREFPTAAEFHADADPARNERFRDEFGGITNFPFTSTALSRINKTFPVCQRTTVSLHLNSIKGQGTAQRNS